jgi:hypothetical protein
VLRDFKRGKKQTINSFVVPRGLELLRPGGGGVGDWNVEREKFVFIVKIKVKTDNPVF